MVKFSHVNFRLIYNLIIPFDKLTSRRKHNKPSTKDDIATIKRIVRYWSNSKVTSVAINIIAINKQMNKAEAVVNAIAQCVHLDLRSNEFSSLYISDVFLFVPSLSTLKRSTIRAKR